MYQYRDVLKQIGLNFRIERTKRRLSQESFAEMVNVHTNYIGKIERGEQNLTIKKIVDISNLADIPLTNILNIE